MAGTIKTTHTSCHPTTTVGQVDVIGFDQDVRTVEILSRGSDYLWFRIDGTDPVIAGDGTLVVTPGGRVMLTDDWPGDVIRITSSTATPYSITGIV